jgi:hypothetical protein
MDQYEGSNDGSMINSKIRETRREPAAGLFGPSRMAHKLPGTVLGSARWEELPKPWHGPGKP